MGRMVGHNNLQDYQVYQSVGGSVSIIDTSGYYSKGFATVWTVPRSMQCYYSARATKKEDRKTIRSASHLMTAARPKSVRL